MVGLFSNVPKCLPIFFCFAGSGKSKKHSDQCTKCTIVPSMYQACCLIPNLKYVKNSNENFQKIGETTILNLFVNFCSSKRKEYGTANLESKQTFTKFFVFCDFKIFYAKSKNLFGHPVLSIYPCKLDSCELIQILHAY